MKKLKTLLVCVFLLPALAWACDEECRRDKAMAEHNVTFPSYLNASYCKTTSVDFLIGARRSLQSYYDERLNSAHRGGARNIRNFLEQRKEWLQECDKYLSLTQQGRVFRTKDTSDTIFAAMTSLSSELEQLIGIRRTANEDGLELTTDVRARFDELFKLIDSHRTDLQLRGLL